MNAAYECGTCGVVTHHHEQVCDPQPLESKDAYCGMPPDAGEMCEAMKDHLTYVCGSCGRPAEQAGVLCDPLLTG